MRKMAVIMLMISLSICFTGCKDNQTGKKGSDEMVVIQDISTPAEPETPVPAKEDGSMTTEPEKKNENLVNSEFWVTPEEYEAFREEERANNPNTAYADKYESNIEVDTAVISEVEPDIYPWLTLPDDIGGYYNVYQWLAYGIDTFYNGNVPENYTITLPDDITETETNMIFTVHVRGEGSELDILLDMYNDKIIVDDGSSKKE